MNRIGALCVALVIGLGQPVWACEARHSDQARTAVAGGTEQTRLLSEAILVETNRARCQEGRRALRLDPGLTAAADDHARAMAARRQMSHSLNRQGRTHLQDRLRAERVSYRRAAENIAQTHLFAFAGQSFSTRGPCQFARRDGSQVPRHSVASLAQSLVAQWLASPPHRKSLLDRRFTRFGAGIGLAQDKQTCGLVYAAQVFAD